MLTRPFAETNVPRYTSYPTAPHFSAAVDAATYAGWLARLPDDAALSLYLHVPYCRELCLYCGCHTKAVRQAAPLDDYTRTLRAEIALAAGRTRARRVTHIHFGGGTPSLLGADNLVAVMFALAHAFRIGGETEIAIELDPRSVDRAMAAALAGMRVSRASLGVQDLSPEVQHAIGRIQPYETVVRATELLRAAGIGQLNFDLMYGLPKQTAERAVRTARLAAALRPQRISLFGYAHVPWMKAHQRCIEEADLPGPDERLVQSEAARAVLIDHGYVPIGLDHFALPDDGLALAAGRARLHRNFQGYTTDDADALIGLGASAIGRLPQGYVQNAPDVGGYARAVHAGRLATVRGGIIERLMCGLRVDLRDVGRDWRDFPGAHERLSPLASEGLVQIDGSSLTVTERGRPFVRLAAAAFDAYLQPDRQRHSQAV